MSGKILWSLNYGMGLPAVIPKIQISLLRRIMYKYNIAVVLLIAGEGYKQNCLHVMWCAERLQLCVS